MDMERGARSKEHMEQSVAIAKWLPQNLGPCVHIHEDALLARMPVKVNIHGEWLAHVQPQQQLLEGVYLRKAHA